MTHSTQTDPAWQGINHIALVTRDLAAALHSYQDILRLSLAALLPASDATSPAGRMHCHRCILAPR
jgi:catechol 2,3-dioxygenase-like lactoylglutathione lyase family enzyme